MYLHGHKFWVLGSGTGSFSYASVTDAPESLINLHNPPYRDTADMPASGWLAIKRVFLSLFLARTYPFPLVHKKPSLPSRADLCIRYRTDNPGTWPLHCHFQWHMVVSNPVSLQSLLQTIPRTVSQPPTNTKLLFPSSQSGMALVLVEGDEALPNLVGALPNSTAAASGTPMLMSHLDLTTACIAIGLAFLGLLL
jgi:Multicopper oxidase